MTNSTGLSGTSIRIPAELEAAARSARPELAALNRSALLRVGLGVLAGLGVTDALTQATYKSGPRPGSHRTAT